MDIQQRKYSLIQWLVNLEDNNLIQKLEEFVHSNSEGGNEWWNSLSKEEQEGLQEGVEDLEKGPHFTYDEIRQGIKEKFNI